MRQWTQLSWLTVLWTHLSWITVRCRGRTTYLQKIRLPRGVKPNQIVNCHMLLRLEITYYYFCVLFSPVRTLHIMWRGSMVHNICTIGITTLLVGDISCPSIYMHRSELLIYPFPCFHNKLYIYVWYMGAQRGTNRTFLYGWGKGPGGLVIHRSIRILYD